MGAKQSKRSVDISGKEAEGGGEVAAAGAGGEGRVEPLADADALKPQLNGDAHIQTEPTEKEKELDSGTPENEKDVTTEKEGKEENDKENEAAPVTNGEAEEKIENGESTPVAEDGKKPKKEKVKKKWSLRSISFSRKDKPKQEKKQKDEELKTNGEPEKVPEETAEAAAAVEPAAEEVATEAAAESAPSPTAPVAAAPQAPAPSETTAPLLNGAVTPEPAEQAPAPAPALAEPEPAPAPAPAPEPEPEQLPVNGLTLEEPKPEVPEEKVEKIEPEPPATETVEIAPAPEIPAKEVCVQQMPLLESTPPPLPANPPPSSVASFAATTMAPELTDASLPNTADTAAEPLSALTDTQSSIDEMQLPPPTSVSDATELPSPLKETSEDMPLVPDAIEPDVQAEVVADLPPAARAGAEASEDIPLLPEDIPLPTNYQNELSKEGDLNKLSDDVTTSEATSESIVENAPEIESTEPKIEIPEPDVKLVPQPEEEVIPEPEPEMSKPEVGPISEPEVELIPEPDSEQMSEPEVEQIPEPEISASEIDDTPLPPPPAQDDIKMETSLIQNGGDHMDIIPEPITETEKIEANHVSAKELTNGVDVISLEEKSVTAENARNKAVALAAARAAPPAEPQPSLAAPAAHTPQEPVSVSDKLADLIPEVPDVPEINTETLQTTEVAVPVAN